MFLEKKNMLRFETTYFATLPIRARRVTSRRLGICRKMRVDNLPLWTCHQAKNGRLSTLILRTSDFPLSCVRISTLIARYSHGHGNSHSVTTA